VRGRNNNPTTHTRMPRYTRGKTGVVERDRGVFPLPDSEHVSAEPTPQHVYLIRFTAHELWGEDASAHDALYIDMWEDYLEPA
jgi:nitrile hydratase